jgi:acetoin utilization deacetylase AcuC-like enzyme
MTLLYSDPLFLKHDTGRHPERPERLRSIDARLRSAGLVERCTVVTPTPLTEDEVRGVHEPPVVERVKQAAHAGGAWLDGDTFVSPASFEVALNAAGACVSAVDAVLNGNGNALCLVRPPGHHATPGHSMGFCLFNNIALAARHAKTVAELTRILVIDWDVHHGNGTQDVFYDDPTVMFFSIHRYGQGFYPGTGADDETGQGRGLGYTRNEAVRYGTRRPDYHGRFRNALEECADRIKPELVLLSAGFDAHREDPIGALGLETEDFAVLTREVLEVARVHAGGRLVSCLEGGYDLGALAESVEAHLMELLSARS